MARVSDKDVFEAVEEMRQETGLPLQPYFAYGRVRITIQGQETRFGRGVTDFSPTFDSNTELMTWIGAFMQGWSMRAQATK